MAILPGGTRITLGRPAINAAYLDPTALVDVAPSLVSPAIFRTKPAPSCITYDYVVRDKHDAWHAVCWDGLIDVRLGRRAFVRFADGSTSLVPWSRFATKVDKKPVPLSSVHPPACVHPDCGEPVEQGLCPIYCGRKSACSYRHFRDARDSHGFVHPGFIAPGDTCVVPFISDMDLCYKRVGGKFYPAGLDVESNDATPMPSVPAAKQKRKRKSPSAEALSPVALPAAAAGDDEIDRIGIAHKAIVAACKSDLPTAWMRIADAMPQPDFISIIDGASGMLNTLTSKFGLKGMPPVDKASESVLLDV